MTISPQIPLYSKSKLDWAGKILTDTKPSSEDLKLAWSMLNNWRACHDYPINTFQSTLRKRLKKVDTSSIVAQRLKRMPAIIAKLKRFPDMRLSQMQDIGGLRAIVGTVPHVNDLALIYKKPNLMNHKLLSCHDYIQNPKPDGYRGIHLVFRYNNTKRKEYNGLSIELQIRTKLQHNWATAVETMDTMLGQSLKLGEGDKKWKSFFSVASSALAYFEKTPLVPQHSLLSKEETFEAVRHAEREINALEKMQSYSVAIDWVNKQQKSWSYHLIVLNSLRKEIQIKSYARNQFENAKLDYTNAEQLAGEGAPIEPVLVSVGPLKDLQKAYPNFFLDIDEFMRILKLIINRR